ncbi:MAG: DUF4139 domain-containing protein [Alphaproteobacteria bacterium]|nr:DUF4139 domain-containing protein [Alphaproteobacteria bacterium]
MRAPSTSNTVRVALVLAIGLICGLGAPAGAAESLALKRVMLSTGGVGYFEHEARVTGDAVLDLDIRLDQVDDVLKSIVVYDATGKVGTIDLPGREPLAEAFRDLPFGKAALRSPAALLQALQGAVVSVTGPRQISGRVLSITRETVTLPKTGAVSTQHRVTLHTEKGLESFLLEESQSVRLTDATLQGQVNAALAAIARHRVADRRRIAIWVTGRGARTVRVAYVVQTPLWKTSYRLTLDRDATAKTGHLQGWAVVENMTGHDWKDVGLALVSGNPVTFRQAIYQAYYVQRPEVPVEVLGRILPRPDTGTVAGQEAASASGAPGRGQPRERLKRAEKRAAGKSRSGALLRSTPPAIGGGYQSGAVAPGLADADLAAPPVARPALLAGARESATQVVFRVPGPISVASGHSFVVPIADTRVAAVRVSLYQPRTHADHPVAAAQLTNDSPSGLPGGVLTLYERDAKSGAVAYLGDAQLRTLPPKDMRMVGFALDEKIRVERESKSSSTLIKGRISQGVFSHTVVSRRTTLYRIKGVQGAPRRLIIEHPRYPGWNLPKQTNIKVELAKGAYRIALDLKPGEDRAISVVTNRPRAETLALTALGASRIRAYASSDSLSETIRDAFKRMGGLMAEIERHKNDVRTAEKKKKDIFDDQRRIRDNMRRVNNRGQLYLRYVKKLDSQENSLQALEDRLEAARAAQRKAEKALADYMAGLDI